MHPQAGQLAAVGIQGAAGIQGTELMQELLPFLQMRLRRWLEPWERLAQAGTPLGQLQDQRRGIGLHHRWWDKGRAALLLGRAPEPKGGPRP